MATGERIIRFYALLVPKLGINLISVRRLCSDHSLRFDSDSRRLVVYKGQDEPVLCGYITHRVYYVQEVCCSLPLLLLPSSCALAALLEVESAFAARTTVAEMDPNSYRLWHRRFVHLGAKKIRNLYKVTTIKKIHVSNDDKDYVCEVCQLSNLRNRAGRVTQRNPELLGLVSLDICGPLDKSRQGYRYFLKIIDNYSRKPWVYPLRNRTDAVASLIQ